MFAAYLIMPQVYGVISNWGLGPDERPRQKGERGLDFYSLLLSFLLSEFNATTYLRHHLK